jgi:hypothetical protein
MPTLKDSQVRLSAVVSPDVQRRLSLHALMTGQSISAVLEELILDHLPNYKVSVDRAVPPPPSRPEKLTPIQSNGRSKRH